MAQDTAFTAFSRIQARIYAGEALSIAQIEQCIADDTAARAAFAKLAAASRAGRAIDYAEIEKTTGFKRGFINACILAAATGSKVQGIHLLHEHEGAVH